MRLPIEKSWSFAEKTIKDTNYISHGYYTYPAKFIPQLAARLITENSNVGDIVVDPFMGSGTTVVEAIIHHRIGVGIDINEIAFLVAKVKSTPINMDQLQEEFMRINFDLEHRLNGQMNLFVNTWKKVIPTHTRIDYWFTQSQKERLVVIFSRILEINTPDMRDFFLIAFAQILKSCSIWLQKSIKPTRDQNKKVLDPILLFLTQVKKMIKRHQDFHGLLTAKIRENIAKFRIISCTDSRNIPCENELATLVVTSPPYVTSYEYADLHQLPSLWFSFMSELPEFRKKFIGSAYNERTEIDLRSQLALDIVRILGNNKKSREVRNYFADMLESFIEMKRVLKVGGRACIVISNTQFQGVDILNAEVFQEQFANIGFKTHNIIHREIPSKMLPSTRDPQTGQFVSASHKNLKLAYPSEYILIMEKL